MFILWIKKADDPVCVKLTELYPTLWGTMDCSLSGSCPQNSPGMNTGVGCHSLLQEIFLTQGSNLDLRHCREILYPLSHQGSLTQLLFAILTPSATERVCEIASVRLFAPLGTVSHQASLSMGFSRQGSLPLTPPGKHQVQNAHMLIFQDGFTGGSDGKESTPQPPTPSTPHPPSVWETWVQSLGWWKAMRIL